MSAAVLERPVARMLGTQRVKSASTRAALIAVGRARVGKSGYHETGTHDLAALALVTCGAGRDQRSADSDHPHTGRFGWTRDQSRFGWDSMIGDAQTISPYCSPAIGENLSGLPPSFIHIGAIDLFLEESLDYARSSTRAGVSVELHVWPGAFHAFGSTDCHVTREARRVARSAITRAPWSDKT